MSFPVVKSSTHFHTIRLIGGCEYGYRLDLQAVSSAEDDASSVIVEVSQMNFLRRGPEMCFQASVDATLFRAFVAKAMEIAASLTPKDDATSRDVKMELDLTLGERRLDTAFAEDVPQSWCTFTKKPVMTVGRAIWALEAEIRSFTEKIAQNSTPLPLESKDGQMRT